jgi:hypothetical protein
MGQIHAAYKVYKDSASQILMKCGKLRLGGS